MADVNDTEYGANWPASSQSIYKESSTQLERLGKIKKFTEEEVEFVYCLCGGTAISAGESVVATTVASDHRKMAVASAGSIGDKKVTFTNGASTAISAGDYEEGYLHFVSGTGSGQKPLRVKQMPAIAVSTNGTVTLQDPLTQAIDTTTKVTLRKSPYDAVQKGVTDQKDTFIGIAPIDVTANNYFWCQTRGIASAKADGAWTEGDALTVGTGTAGTLTKIGAAADQEVGVADDTAANGEFAPVFLRA